MSATMAAEGTSIMIPTGMSSRTRSPNPCIPFWRLQKLQSLVQLLGPRDHGEHDPHVPSRGGRLEYGPELGQE
jgi:hypothetical protein